MYAYFSHTYIILCTIHAFSFILLFCRSWDAFNSRKKNTAVRQKDDDDGGCGWMSKMYHVSVQAK